MKRNADEKETALNCIDLGLLAKKTCIDDEEDNEPWQKVAEVLTRSFEEIGCAYIKNHGIPEEIIDNMVEVGAKFFALPNDIKEKYAEETTDRGYIHMDKERLHPSGEKSEIREMYDMLELYDKLPSENAEFLQAAAKLTEQSKNFSYKLLRCLEIGLNIPKGTFLTKHLMPVSPMNCSVLRIIHYPPIPDDIKEGATRCGAHSDYGTFTLLFQDNMGGLEVKTRNGLWLKADPVPGTILINVGDLLENYTAGKFIAAKHRVLVPKDEVRQRCSRRSMAYFLNPEDDVLVKPLDGSSTYLPITSGQYMEKRHNETFN